MMFLDSFVYRFFNLNHIFEKINNKVYLYCNKFFKSFYNIKEDVIIPFYFNKFKYNLFSFNGNFKFIEDDESFLDVISKTLNGFGNDLKCFNSICSCFSVISSVKCVNTYFYMLNFCNNKNNSINIKFDYNINFYNDSYILFPLSFSSNLNVSNYIYSIYKYIISKNLNCYKSSFISMFYYYVGLIFFLSGTYKYSGINVLESNIFVIANRLSSFVIVENSYNCDIVINSILPIKLINIINNSLYLSCFKCCNYSPYLIGLSKYSIIFNGIFSRLSFQETIRFFKNIVLQDKIDWNVDSKSNIILSNFIPVGSGWYRYFID